MNYKKKKQFHQGCFLILGGLQTKINERGLRLFEHV